MGPAEPGYNRPCPQLAMLGNADRLAVEYAARHAFVRSRKTPVVARICTSRYLLRSGGGETRAGHLTRLPSAFSFPHRSVCSSTTVRRMSRVHEKWYAGPALRVGAGACVGHGTACRLRAEAPLVGPRGKGRDRYGPHTIAHGQLGNHCSKLRTDGCGHRPEAVDEASRW